MSWTDEEVKNRIDSLMKKASRESQVKSRKERILQIMMHIYPSVKPIDGWELEEVVLHKATKLYNTWKELT